MSKVEKHGDKTKIAIQVMEANVGKSYDEVCDLIAAAIGVPVARARVYYRHKVINKLAKGYENMTRPYPWEGKARTPKTPKVKVDKLTKAIAKVTKAKTPKAELSAEAKTDRLALIKQVGSRRKAAGLDRAFDGKRGRPMTADEAAVAKEEVADMMNDLDSFKAPKFLTKAQVRALV